MMLPVANVLQPLITFCESILTFWHDTVGFSWGLSIIFLTFVIRLLILPLTFKQVRSMQSLQRLQPEIKKIQARFKDDKQRMNQEMMKFYQEHKVNPLSSCLPILLQLPFFLALFYMLRHDLRMDVCGQTAVPCGQVPGAHGESFLFIHDITDKATGAALVVLIVLYVGSQLISGLITTFTADRSDLGGLLTLGGNTTLRIVTGSSFPAKFDVSTLAVSSTVDYYGTDTQLVTDKTYGNLYLSNGGVNQKSLTGNSTVAGDLLINIGATLDASAFGLEVKGNWTNNGAFTASGSSITLSGFSKNLSGITTFNNLRVGGAYTGLSDITVVGTMALSGTYAAGSTTCTFLTSITSPSSSAA